MTNSKLFYSVFLFSYFCCLASFSLDSNHKCVEEQNNALLLFKQSLLSINFSIDEPPYYTPCSNFLGSAYYPVMMNWSTDIDCCNWDGITCDHFTGDVIGIDLSCGMLQGSIHPNSTLFDLPHLRRLNLAFNDFTSSEIPREIGRFSNSLTHLNISTCELTGQIPSEILFLERLISIDLSSNLVLEIQPTVFSRLLQNSTHLREVLFAYVNISWVLPTRFNISSHLKTLDLTQTNLKGKLPDNIFDVPHLQKLVLSGNIELTGPLTNANMSTTIPLKWLDLSYTGLYGKIPDTIGNLKFLNYLNLKYTAVSQKIPHSIGDLKFLKFLDLSYTLLSGKIPDSIGNLRFLHYLSFSYTRLSGHIPDLIGNLEFLDYLDLSSTRLSGKIPDSIGELRSLNHLDLSHCLMTGFLPKSIVNLTHLSTIDLSYNKLNGTLPSLLFTLPSLETLMLKSNMFSGGLPSVLSNSSPLKELSLSNNQFDGEINQGFVQLMNLTYIDLQFNNFIGLWELDTVLSSLPKLETLHLSHSGLSVVASNVTGYVSAYLNELGLASCKLTMFPGSIHGMKFLTYLDLSENYIQGQIPDWAGTIGENLLFYLDLSYNSITKLPRFQLDRLQYVSVQSNQIEGQFPPSVCNMSSMLVLDLSNNHFSGVIPQCFGNIFSILKVVNMGNNSFHGTIPNVNVDCGALEWFILNGNQLEGDIPSFLSKCQKLVVLDIGNNRLNGSFPSWLGNLSLLRILVLKHNNLIGSIETTSTFDFPFPSLQVLDLSENKFVGHLPQKYFQNFKAMKNKTEDLQLEYLMLHGTYLRFNGIYLRFYDMNYSLAIEVKDHQQFFPKINVHYTIVDLSNNNFEGEMPIVIGNLISLKVLNLSHNNLNGRIPYAFGNLLAIESLDLSSNQLKGEIPQSLVDMTNLAVLNLSQNNLVGPIPQGKQFNTFDETSFSGNMGLCGHPLPQLCEHRSSPQLKDEEESEFTWKEVMLGYGFGTVVGLMMGYLMLSTGKPRWFNTFAHAIEHTILKKQDYRRHIYIAQ